MVCAAVLGSDKVPSGSRIRGNGSGRKTGWLVHGAGFSCNVMRILHVKGSLLEVQLEAVVGDSNGIDTDTGPSGMKNTVFVPV